MALEINNNNNKAACIESLVKSDLGKKNQDIKNILKNSTSCSENRVWTESASHTQFSIMDAVRWE